MLRRIILDNYMSHGRTVIEPAEGLTVIVGPNNCGKSAIASALQTLCGDHDGDFMVRHGERACSVTVETDDGHTIVWRRVKGKVSYVLDGVDVHRTSRSNLPDDLDAFLRLPKVRHPNGEKEFDVHFGQQKSPIFLIDRESDTAAFFSTASDAQKLLEIQKLHKDKSTEARRQHQTVTRELSDLDAQLAALEPLDALTERLGAVEGEQQDLAGADQQSQSLELLLKEMRTQEEVAAFQRRSAAALQSLAPAPAMEDTASLATQVEKLERAATAVRRARAEVGSISDLIDPPVLDDDRAMLEFLRGYGAASRKAREIASVRAALVELGEPPALEDSAALQELLARYAAGMATAQQHRQSLREIGQRLAGVEADIAAWLWANPNCPTCGAPTSREHFLHEGHRVTEVTLPEGGTGA